MKLTSQGYYLELLENTGGEWILEIGKTAAPSEIVLYRSEKPLILFLKDYAAKHVEFSAAYTEAEQAGDALVARGTVTTPLGSVFSFEDTYGVADENVFSFRRHVSVKNAQKDDLGFGTRIALGLLQDQDPKAYNYLAPGAWYRHNETAPAHWIGHNMDLPSYWYKETRFALPFFAMQNILNGETVSFSRKAADITLSEPYENHFDSRTDATYTFGSLGMSVPDGLSIDYLYPGTEGYNEDMTPYRRGPYSYQFGLNKRYHPVEAGFTQDYSLLWRFSKHDEFYAMLKEEWRYHYGRFNPKLAPVDNKELYEVSMNMLDELCRNYYGSWGVPFKCLLPSGEIGIVDYQMGFIGQQPNIGYQLIRYGYEKERQETIDKGVNVLDFWVHNSLTEWGAPKTWYDAYPPKWLDQPIWFRMMSDGMEGILDGYNFLKKKGVEKPEWLEYCKTVASWLVSSADEEGCWHRAYNFDGTVRLESKANTSNIIRFLVQLYLTTRDETYKACALKAGEWCYEHVYKNMEYVGGTCDNADVLDKESGIYALFAFLSLYDLTEEEKWLTAAKAAADYLETWTYSWVFPVRPVEKVHALHHRDMSGQSLIATGHSACDVYMAACHYVFYRLYVITGDTHYRDFARFISKNPKQLTDLDGSFGYGRRGLCEESCSVYNFASRGVYAWLPWVTYVQIDPVSRMVDTFGAWEVDEADALPMEELKKRNRIYDNY